MKALTLLLCAWAVWSRVGASEPWTRFDLLDNRADCIKIIDRSEAAHRPHSLVVRIVAHEMSSHPRDRKSQTFYIQCLPTPMEPKR